MITKNQLVHELFLSNEDETIYFSDVADVLGVQLREAVRLCWGLIKSGEIEEMP